jgi:hypothetical protein
MLALSLISSSALAATSPTWELGGSANLTFGDTVYGDGGGSTASFSLGVEGGRFVTPEWEVGGSFAYYVIKSSGSNDATTALEFRVGPTFNFLGLPGDAFFATAQIGIYAASFGGSSSSRLTYLLGVGKRFALTESISWAPELTYTGYAANDATGSRSIHSFAAIPVRISLLF